MTGTATTVQDAARRAFAAALLAGDAVEAEEVALRAIDDGVPLGDLYVEVIGRALHEVGDRWERGQISIADEHLATGIAWDVLGLLARRESRHPRRSRERILLAAVGGEAHVTGLRIVGDLAEAHGFDVRYLGAAVPVPTLAAIVARQEPEVVGLSVTMAGPASELSAAIGEVLGARCAPRAVLVGGRAAPAHGLPDDPRVVVAGDAREALAAIERVADPVG